MILRKPFFKKPKNSIFKKRIGGDFIKGGIHALLGVALLSATASALSRIRS